MRFASPDTPYLESQSAFERTNAELEDYRDSCSLLEYLVSSQSEVPCSAGQCGVDDVCTDLGGRRILCVGGHNSLMGHYRYFVKRCNGEFVHDDGGIEDNRKRLEPLLAGADVVVCPAHCVSHDAYLRAKRFCKRTAKPCVLLKTFGVAAFARALGDVAA